MKQKSFFIIILSIGILFLMIGGYFFYRINENSTNFIREQIYIEFGHPVTINDVFVTAIEDGFYFSTPLDSLKDVGDYSLTVSIKNKAIPLEVHIIDSTDPILEVHPLTIYFHEELPTSEQFVSYCEDLSHCSYQALSLEKKAGTQNVVIIATDDYGNQTTKQTTLTILESVDEIVFEGLNPITIQQGNSANLKTGVHAISKLFGELNFSVDDSAINYQQPGTYDITYTASNSFGNIISRTRKITINSRDTTYMIEKFPTFSQYPKYPNGCETIALYNLLRFYNVSVTPDELVERLTKGEGPYLENGIFYGGDPEIEFVGDPRNLKGYGVFQKPILDLASNYRNGMVDYSGHSLHDVLSLVRQQIPVQVWVSIGLKDTGVCHTWTHRNTGKEIKWICNLHSVIVIGYNSTSVYVSDSYTGKIESYSRSQFEKMYNLFGKRALYFPN